MKNKAATISEAERPPKVHPVQANNPALQPSDETQLPPGQSTGVPDEDAPTIGSTSTTTNTTLTDV